MNVNNERDGASVEKGDGAMSIYALALAGDGREKLHGSHAERTKREEKKGVSRMTVNSRNA